MHVFILFTSWWRKHTFICYLHPHLGKVSPCPQVSQLSSPHSATRFTHRARENENTRKEWMPKNPKQIELVEVSLAAIVASSHLLYVAKNSADMLFLGQFIHFFYWRPLKLLQATCRAFEHNHFMIAKEISQCVQAMHGVFQDIGGNTVRLSVLRYSARYTGLSPIGRGHWLGPRP